MNSDSVITTSKRMNKHRDRFLTDFGRPFLICFAIVSILFTVIEYSSNTKQLPPIVLILSPHFDDAVLSQGGLIATSQTPVIVATFFGGKPTTATRGGWDRLSGFQNGEEAVATRTAENALALEKIGAHLLNLKYLDFQYQYERDQRSEDIIRKSMEKDIDIILENLKSSGKISIYGPSEFGQNITHPDHKLLHEAFVEIVRKYFDRKNLNFFFYEDFPYVAQYMTSTTTPLKNFLETKNPSFTLREKVDRISKRAIEKKTESIKAYDSQDKAFGALGDNIADETKTFNKTRCQKTQPAWYACEAVYEILFQ